MDRVQKLSFLTSTARLLQLVTCIALVTCNVLVNHAHAAPPSSQEWAIQNERIGIQGVLKIGCWAPVSFEIIGGQGRSFQPVVRTSDPDGNPVIQQLPIVSIPQSQGVEATAVHGVFRPGRLGASIQIGLKEIDSKQPVRWSTVRGSTGSPIQVKQSTNVWLVIGDQPPFLSAASRWNGILDSGIELITASDLGEPNAVLPVNSEGLDMVDLIVMSAGTPVRPAESLAIKNWVQRGGRFVITMGDSVQHFTQGPLAEWMPIVPVGESDIRNLGGLNAAVPGSSPLRLLGSLKAAQLDEVQGRVLASGITGPLLMRAAYGIGQVTVLAVDMDQRPISNWDNSSQTDFATVLANLSPPWENKVLVQYTKDVDSNLSPTGVSDLQTQLVNILDDFSDVSRSSHWKILGWISLFLVLIGPLDYFLLHHVLKQPRLTWITLPAWILLTSLFAISNAKSVNQQPLQSRQISIVDIDPSVRKVRSKAWMNFYSPVTSRNEISSSMNSNVWPTEVFPEFIRTSWVERPESSFRGMYREGDFDLGKPEYSFSADRTRILNLPTTAWSSGSASCEWEFECAPLAQSMLTVEGGNRISGTFSHDLPCEINNWFVAFGSFAYYPRTSEGEFQAPLAPGESVDIERLGSNLLKGVLIGLKQSAIYRKKGDRTDPRISRDNYDILNNDPFAAMRMVSFHHAAGGTEYTHLENQSNHEMDLSQLLSLHRAVLFGRIEQPGTSFEIDGSQPVSKLNETYVRIIFPVEKKVRDNDAAPDAIFLKPVQ